MSHKPGSELTEPVEGFIRLVRGQRVMLDWDLARIYGVSTARLNQQVNRNLGRFPSDFVFQLTAQESTALMLQSATSKHQRGGRRKRPYAFSEHGAIMAANVLKSGRAVQMSVFVVRAFVKMRETLAQNTQLAVKLAELEKKLTQRLDIHEKAILHILEEIKRLMEPLPQPVPERREMGFHVRDGSPGVSPRANKGPMMRASDLQRDPLYKAKPLGRSRKRKAAVRHDVLLYPREHTEA